MSLSEIGIPAQRVDVLNGGDVAPDGRLLSVAEIQQAFRELRARKPSGAASASALVPEQEQVGVGGHPGEAPPIGTDRPSGSARSGQLEVTYGADLDGTWVSVVAAHAGAGASTVALAIADSAAAAGRATHLVETAHPTRSGLIAAANAELGLDASGAWRRGSRARVTIDRRAGNDNPAGWPAFMVSDDGLVIVDLGLPTPASLARLATSGCRIVVVCRPTVPGVRLAEQLLNSITGPVIVASVGSSKWPGEVNASLGPRLRELRAINAVVAVPADRRLEVTGPTNSPLPKPVFTAGRSLLGLIDAARSGDATRQRDESAQSMPRRKGTNQWSLR
jgi:hypothetical protein